MTAEILWFMERKDEALESARAAMFRLSSLRANLGEDYRILQAEARLSPILGESTQELLARVNRARTAEPDDAVEFFRNEMMRARALSLGGLVAEATESLDRVLSGPNEFSVFIIDADPAFDGIRNEPEFIEMLERYR